MYFAYLLVMIGETWFVGAIAGRMRVLHIIFGEDTMEVYSPAQLHRQFFLPMLVLAVCLSNSLFC